MVYGWLTVKNSNLNFFENAQINEKSTKYDFSRKSQLEEQRLTANIVTRKEAWSLYTLSFKGALLWTILALNCSS